MKTINKLETDLFIKISICLKFNIIYNLIIHNYMSTTRDIFMRVAKRASATPPPGNFRKFF